MKLPMKRALPIAMLSALLLLGACGKKENKINTNAYGSTPFSTNNPVFSGSGGSTIVSQYQSIKGSVACLSGRARLANDVSFYVQGNFTGTRIAGNWQPGFMSNGTITDMYVGVSAFNDLMFLTKVTNGSQVVGYNVTLSYCEMPSGYANYPAVISNDRPLVNFRTLPYQDYSQGINIPDGIIINTAKPCGYGLIASAYTVILSQRNSSPFTWDFWAYTSFAAPGCRTN